MRSSPTPTSGEHENNQQLVELAVQRLVGIFINHEEFLRAVVLISNAHPEVLRRGSTYIAQIRDLFVTVVKPVTPDDGESTHNLEFCFSMVFSAMVLRVAYGPGFGPTGSTITLTSDLTTMTQRFLSQP